MNKQEILENLNKLNKNTLMETLGIKFTDVGEDFLEGIMSVNSKVHQPMGLLHGGASVAFAESLGSLLSGILVRDEGKVAVGTNIHSSHLRSKKNGVLRGRAKIIKKGSTLHNLSVEIRDEEGKIICHSVMTNMIIDSSRI